MKNKQSGELFSAESTDALLSNAAAIPHIYLPIVLRGPRVFSDKGINFCRNTIRGIRATSVWGLVYSPIANVVYNVVSKTCPTHPNLLLKLRFAAVHFGEMDNGGW